MTPLPIISYSQLSLGETLAKTAHADVHLSTWQTAKVVVKEFRLSRMTEEGQAEFLQEANLTFKLSHPHVVRLFGICNEKNHYCLVIEHIAQGALQTLLASPIPLSWDARLQIGADMTSGLAYLHAQQILHRDLKSGNVLIDAASRAKLTDFGQAKLKSEALKTSSVRGTLAWSPPELFEDRPLYTEKSDIYSLGMTLWELTSRQTPYANLPEPAIMRKIDKGDLPSIPSDTPPPLVTLIQTCWQKEAQKRPLATEVLKTLDTLPRSPIASSNSHPPTPTPLAASPQQAPRTVADLTRILKPLTSNPQVKADKELKALFSDKLAELLIQEETNLLKGTDQPFCRTVQHLIDEDGQINDMFKQALLKIWTPNVFPSQSLPPIASSSSSKPASPTLPIAIPLALPTSAFGAAAWSTHFGDVGTEPSLPSNIHEILNASCPYWPDKKVSETHMLVLIPEKVNGRPLTLTTLGELVKTPKKGNAGNYYENNLFHTYGDTPAPTSHWILMTRNVIPGSRNKPFTVQKTLLKGGDTVPKLLDASTAIFMQNASGGKHGYVRDPLTYTRCEEPYNQRQMVVGGFAPPPGGLFVNFYYFDDGNYGLAAFRLF